MSLRTTWRIVVALLVTLAVLAIFVSPLVDSPRTVLRAKHLAQLIVLALISLAVLLAGLAAPRGSAEILQAADMAPPPLARTQQKVLPLLC